MINPSIRISFTLILGLILINSISQDLQTSDSLKLELAMVQDVNHKMDILVELAEIHSASDPDLSLDYANQALNFANENNSPGIKILAYLLIADVYWSKTDLKSSMEVATTAKEMAEEFGRNKELAEATLIIGKIYNDLGDYDKSSDLNFKALKIFDDLKNLKGKGKTLNRIGYDYFEQGNFDKALDYYFQSLDIAREIYDLVGVARGLNNVAAVYGSKNEYEKVEIFLREAVEINKRTGRRLWEGINYLNLGVINREVNSYDTALYYFNKALTIFEELNNVPKIATCQLGLSKYYSETGAPETGLNYAINAFQLGRENNLKRIIQESAGVLHDLFVEMNDVENAYKYSRIQSQVKDSLDLETTMTRMSQLEMMYDFEKINQEKKIKQQKREYTYIILGTAIIFIMVLFVISLFYRNRIRAKNALIAKKQLEAELEASNKELASNVMSLMRKNEVLTEIADKLMEIRQEAVKDETKSAIKKIASRLHRSTDEKIWQEFELRFKQVHSGFYDTLLNHYPDLSPNELRLCALLRLNLTTKEISELTGQRTGTLEIARSRLRKKLGITNTQTNLVTFLSQI